MMAIRMKSNIPHVRGVLSKFPNKLDIASEQIGQEWANMIVKMSRAQAPVFTGTLRDGIKATPTGKKTWVVGIYGKAYRYGRYLERGFTPHWVPFEYIQQHMENPGVKGTPVGDPVGYFLSHANNTNTGFISKSFNRSKSRLPRLVRKDLNKNLTNK